MRVAVAHVAAVQDQRMIQQRAVAVLGGVQLLQELGEQREVIILDLHQLLDLVRAVLVVRRGVMAVGNAHLRIGPVADLARHHEGEHAADVGLIRERQKIVHDPDVLFVGERNARRLLRQLHVGIHLLAGFLDAPLDFANVLQILADLEAVLAARPWLAGRWLPSSPRRGCCGRPRSARCRSSAVPPVPNIRSNTFRGLISMGSGVVCVRQESVFM